MGRVYIDCGGPCSVGDALSMGFYLLWIAFLMWFVRDTIFQVWGKK